MVKYYMQNSNALTASALALGLLSFTLSNVPLKTPSEHLAYPPSAIYQTRSADLTINNFVRVYTRLPQLAPREEALAFFGDQRAFSDDERITYWDALESMAKNTGINLFDFL